MGDDNDSSLASLTAILDESLLDASTSEASEAQSRKGTKSAVKPTRKGRTSAEKRTNKQAGEKLSNTQSPPKDGEAGKVPRRTTDSHTSTVAEDMADIKQQLKELTGSLALTTPVVTEIKSAYDNYNQSLTPDSDEGNGSESELEQTDDVSDTLGEPPKKKPKEESSVLASMAKVVNKPQQDGEDLAPELSELVKQLLSKGMSKEARDELMDKFPTPGNCNRLEVVRVNPEIFNSVRKEVKTEDVMLQKAQKPLLKGIIAVTRILDDFMKAEKNEKPLPSSVSVMKILSDSISLLSDASHEIDLRRRTLFKGDMKTEYRLLCSDQNPVENGLLFGTELGKSVKDLTEASKVTSKVAMKQKRPHASSQSFHGRSESRRSFPFLGRGRGSVSKQRGGYRNPPHMSQPQYQPRR